MTIDRAEYLKLLRESVPPAKIIGVVKPVKKEKTYTNIIKHNLYKKAVVFSGTLESMGRREATEYVEDMNGIVHDAMRRGTDYLIVPDDFNGNTNKAKTAKIYGVKLMYEKDFLKILREKGLWS